MTGYADGQRVAVRGQGRAEGVGGIAERVAFRQEARLELPRGEGGRRRRRQGSAGGRKGDGEQSSDDR